MQDTWRVEILLYCPSGQKQSVSMARILTHAIHHHGYEVLESVYASVDPDKGHNATCKYCGDNAWLEMSEARNRLLHYATNCITRMCKDIEGSY